ncbi:hypothetical protein TRFO_29869 [Tritrichomonas foetus]|uniref:Ubiquitin-like domain-containing protein n=1 Tax=Tritrichomonas foetus TaxID=1144522 RepID=A0A1J4JZG7_9EUKA|nr:hypothetical protein TRFO_29869 [Tritrichomonas foetus]|eukprot:OHT02924.1 hypothetical protein TRFO_29869 [Tritrichomonas foetus]
MTEKIQIQIDGFLGKELVEVDPSFTPIQFKEQLEAKHGSSVWMVAFVLENGRRLEDNISLEKQGVVSGMNLSAHPFCGGCPTPLDYQ